MTQRAGTISSKPMSLTSMPDSNVTALSMGVFSIALFLALAVVSTLLYQAF
ncbi:hypothetical protein [Anaeromusa sp.]|uniref:hypothetical protein n=1 Tax=Anaeromusa sp. TaxID=1872520 RepID=UPI0029C693D5|nr:hypothetical protein [Anaeromusa sp.]MEA4836255.1 hypothetical protein [Anaeromusa sp.]